MPLKPLAESESVMSRNCSPPSHCAHMYGRPTFSTYCPNSPILKKQYHTTVGMQLWCPLPFTPPHYLILKAQSMWCGEVLPHSQFTHNVPVHTDWQGWEWHPLDLNSPVTSQFVLIGRVGSGVPMIAWIQFVQHWLGWQQVSENYEDTITWSCSPWTMCYSVIKDTVDPLR